MLKEVVYEIEVDEEALKKLERILEERARRRGRGIAISNSK